MRDLLRFCWRMSEIAGLRVVQIMAAQLSHLGRGLRPKRGGLNGAGSPQRPGQCKAG